MRVCVRLTLKRSVLDPQGEAVKQSLHALGFEGVGDVRVGKLVEIDVAETDRDAARAQVARMCEDLLANTVIEDYSVDVP